MTYIEYITNAASRAQQFGSDCLDLAGEVAAALPEKAAAISAMTAEYAAAAAAASSDFVAAASYESYNAIINASSELAEALGDAVVNAPSYVESLAGVVADYSTAAIEAAENYLMNDEAENNLQWIQKQDDGVYIAGDGGTTGGAGVPDGWEVSPYPKYPEGVPLVPPQIIPTGKHKIKKFRPPTDTTPKGCLNKRDPKMGEIIMIQTTNPVSDVFWVLYWDNIVFRTQSKSYGSPAVSNEYCKGTPAAMPTFTDISKFASLAPGRYVIESVNHNEGVIPMGHLSEFYDTVERWGWQYHFSWGDVVEVSHTSEYHECLSIEFGDYSGMYFYPVGTVDGDSAGSGGAIHYTMGRIQMRFLGANFPPVTETPEDTPGNVGAYLAFQQIHAFNNIVFMLLGGNYGKS